MQFYVFCLSLQYLCDLLESNDGYGRDIEDYLLREHEVLVLLQGWRMFLLVAASKSVSNRYL